MIKNQIKIILFTLIFSIFNSLPSFAMEALESDIFELDVANHTSVQLRQIPINNFKRSRIKLTNINSKKKFFDDDANYTQSICYKLYNVIYEMIQNSNRSFIIKKIEYSYPQSEKEEKWQFELNLFMNRIAEGRDIIKYPGAKGGWLFKFDINYPNDQIPNFKDLHSKNSNKKEKCYNIVIIRNTERVKSIEEAVRDMNPTMLPNIPFLPNNL